MLLERFFRHALQRVRRRTRKKLIPTTLGFDLGEESGTDSFLFALRQLVRLFDGTLEEFSHQR